MPASVDSIVSSNGQEDHVSMGANAATKLIRVMENVDSVLAIELFNASQALHFRSPAKSSEKIEQVLSNFRKRVPIVTEDVMMAPLIQKSKVFLESFIIKEDYLN